MVDVAHVRPHHEAVVAGDAAALDYFGGLAGDAGDLGDLARRRADADDGAERVAQRPRVDVDVVAADDAVALEATEALGDSRRGQADAAAELRHAEARVGLQLGEEPEVRHVQRIVGDRAVLPSVRSHRRQTTSDRPWTKGPAPGTLSGHDDADR